MFRHNIFYEKFLHITNSVNLHLPIIALVLEFVRNGRKMH